jgi:hypothetical protein
VSQRTDRPPASIRRARSAGDIPLELFDQCLLVFDYGLDEVADRYNTDDAGAFAHRQVTGEILIEALQRGALSATLCEALLDAIARVRETIEHLGE